MLVFTTAMVVKENHLEKLWRKGDHSPDSYTYRCTNSKKLHVLENLETISGIVFVGTAIIIIVTLCRLCILLGA